MVETQTFPFKRPQWRCSVYVALCATLLLPATADGTGSTDLVLVRRVIDTRYFNLGGDKQGGTPLQATVRSPIDWSKVQLRSAMVLQDALGSEILREANVLKGDSLSALVLREYGFGRRNSSDAYTAIEKKILASNGLNRPEDLVAGTSVKVPALPPMAKLAPSSYNTNNLIPKTSSYSERKNMLVGRAFDVESLTYRERPQLSFALRDGAPLVVQYLWLPKAQVARERKLAGDSDGVLEVHSEIVTARFDSSQPADSSSGFPTPPERELITGKLADKPLQAPVLMILDDGWPSDAEFQHSIRWLTTAFKAIEKKFKYPIGPNLQALGTAKGTSFPKAKFHARLIEQSLASLTALEPTATLDDRRVRVVFLPMTTAQVNSTEVLEDIIALRLMDDLMGIARGDDPPPPAEVRLLRSKAKEIVARIPKDIGVVDITTDKAVIESVLWFADLYAKATGNPYIANFSWTTPKLANRYADLRFHHGLLVSAAGNASASNCTACRPPLAFKQECSCADNVAAEGRWFAVRAVDGQDVITVMNTAKDGSLQCKSSIVGSQTKEPMAVALDGNVGPDVCGTSFAAPRVAWLAAARLAYYDPKTFFPNDVDRGQQLLNVVKNARTGGSGKDDQFNLDIQKLFNF